MRIRSEVTVNVAVAHLSIRIMEERFLQRDLVISDYDKGYLELLGQLTIVDSVSRDAFEARLHQRRLRGDHTRVIEDTQKGQVVATGSLILEPKFIRNCGIAGHIEDVVVDGAYRGKDLGRAIIQCLVSLAEREGCYKVILDCGEQNVAFYEKCGLERKGIEMAKYFN